jgi:lysophospholipase L1-like esterase
MPEQTVHLPSSETSGSKALLFSAMACLLVIALLEGVGSWVLHRFPAIAMTRELLAGEKIAETDVNATPQAYLLYIPTPGFVANGIQQNNMQGYRGDAIPLQRQPDSLRVLFLGGSTTYGEGVHQPSETYPAQLGVLLQQDPALAGRRVEIINAGLRWGTTAEILTHYLLKYRYYRPDLVVINPGGNDPVAYTTPGYQPDYSHWRKPPRALESLPPQSRWLLHSRFVSVAVVLLFYPDVAEGSTFVHNGEKTPAWWFTARQPGHLRLDEQAFYNNLSSVVREIRQDGARVLLLSYQGNPFDEGDQASWRQYYDHEERVLQRVATEQGVLFAPFPLAQMPAGMWVDPSHLNAEGERIKAAYVYQQLAPVLPALSTIPSRQPEDEVDTSLDLDLPWR